MTTDRHPLRTHWPFALAALAVVLALGGVAAYLPKAQYQANATLLAQPANAADYGSVSVSGIQFLLPAVSEQVRSDVFRARVRALLSAAGAPTSAVDHLSASTVAGSGVIHLSAQDHVPRAAQAAVNTASAELIRRKLSPILQISVLDTAALPSTAASPRRTRILVAAGVLGLIAALAAAYAAAALFGPRRVLERQAPEPGQEREPERLEPRVGRAQ